MKLKLKRNDKIGFTFFLAFIISTTLLYHFEEQFDEQLWKYNPLERHKMFDAIVEEKLLIGKSKQQVLEILGQPDSTSTSSQNFLIYFLGKPPSFFASEQKKMIVRFSNNKAVKVAELENE